MDRDEFMELVYETFADEPDNVLANGIIEAADAYAEHEKAQLFKEGTTSDTISRQAAIDIGRNATVDTNPSHFEAHQKFTQFMDDAEVSSFGRWQWANGFNTALTAVGIDLKKLPSIQPEQCGDKSYTLWKESYEELKRRMDELTSCSDIISRQAAIDAIVQCTNCGDEDTLRGYVLKHNLDNGWTGGILEALDAVKDLPTVQPEPKEGHWIKHESPDGDEQYECSRCGVLWEFNDGTPEDNEAYFCPKCGAKMKGERQK